MICPLLTYADMPAAMAELAEVFGLEIVWLGEAAAEIRWEGGVVVAQIDQPEALHGSHPGQAWTYVRVDDPDAHHARTLERGGRALNEPHSAAGAVRNADTAPAMGKATFGRSRRTCSAANRDDSVRSH